MPVWLNLFFGVSSYAYSGVLYRYGGRSYSLGGDEAWGRGRFNPYGVRVGFRSGIIFGLDYRSGEVARVWRTAGGIDVDDGNRMWALDLSVGKRWRYPMNPYFIAHVSVSLALRRSAFVDDPDFPSDTEETTAGYGVVIKGLGGIFYTPWPRGGWGVGANLILDLVPFTLYGGRDFTWTPLMGQVLGGSLSVVWEKLP